jgi:glyoxylate utilization-related uncharacterized protein
LQPSLVQTLPSLQSCAAPGLQVPPPQTSLVVQALPSSQGAVLLVYAQPVAGMQVSSVHPLLSLQLGAAPPTQEPPEQVSLVVQAFPSLQDAVLLLWVQPVAGLQASLVQPLLSLQLGAAPPTQVPLAQVSPAVQALPSLHDAVLLVCVQPVAGLQPSLVQTLPSSQLGADPPAQAPPEQVSLVVQALPSLQGAVLLVWAHPVAGMQVSSVHPLLSLQLGATPPAQAPPAQVSPVVQAFPSLHDAALLAWVQPVAGLQASLVQTLPSLQFGAGPPTQVPPAQVSLVVQALPSLHDAVLLVWVHPVAGLQASSVQPLLSLQLGAAPPTQAPLAQASLVVQALPSLQDAVLLV